VVVSVPEQAPRFGWRFGGQLGVGSRRVSPAAIVQDHEDRPRRDQDDGRREQDDGQHLRGLPRDRGCHSTEGRRKEDTRPAPASSPTNELAGVGRRGRVARLHLWVPETRAHVMRRAGTCGGVRRRSRVGGAVDPDRRAAGERSQGNNLTRAAMRLCRRLMIRRRSRNSRRTGPAKRSAIAFARGARGGVLMIWTSAAVNVRSRSRMRTGGVGGRCRGP
jgi:hypothetical protein